MKRSNKPSQTMCETIADCPAEELEPTKIIGVEHRLIASRLARTRHVVICTSTCMHGGPGKGGPSTGSQDRTFGMRLPGNLTSPMSNPPAQAVKTEGSIREALLHVFSHPHLHARGRPCQRCRCQDNIVDPFGVCCPTKPAAHKPALQFRLGDVAPPGRWRLS